MAVFALSSRLYYCGTPQIKRLLTGTWPAHSTGTNSVVFVCCRGRAGTEQGNTDQKLCILMKTISIPVLRFISVSYKTKQVIKHIEPLYCMCNPEPGKIDPYC